MMVDTNHWNYGQHWSPEIKEKMRLSHLAPPEGDSKWCRSCNRMLPIESFPMESGQGRHRAQCKSCRAEVRRKRIHSSGAQRPMSEATDSTVFLGVYVAERVLSGLFKDIKKMPYGNPGYDFICGKGFKIDAKSSCLHPNPHGNGYWKFQIKYNTIPDYFLCLAFDDRSSLEPQHIWLIPENAISHKNTFNVSDSHVSLARWAQYEKPIDKVIVCCEVLRGVHV